MAKLKDGFYKQTTSSIGSDLHVLLAGGGSKALSDFAYKSDLTGFVTGGPYLPLTGGTVTGDLHVNTFHIKKNNFSLDNSGTFWIGVSENGELFRTDKDWYHSYTILDIVNYTSYTVKKDGTGATGTWGIDISGNADTVDGYHASSFYIQGRGDVNAQVDLQTIPKDISGGWRVTNSGWAGMVAVLAQGHKASNRAIGFLFKGGQSSRINLLTQVDNTWSDRGVIAYTSDIPAVTNYYWADQLITSSAKSDTTPTFGGATINGNLSVTRDAGSAVPFIPLQVTGTGTLTGQRLIQAFSPDLPTGTSGASGAHIVLGVKESARNFGYMKFAYAGDGSVNNAIRFGFHSSDNLMSIVTNGNVGISTEDPKYKLDVNGDARTNYLTFNDGTFSSNTGNGRIGSFDRPSSVTVQIGGYGKTQQGADYECFRIINNAWNTDLFHVTNLGNVGIGTVSPTHKLHVDGAGVFKNTGSAIYATDGITIGAGDVSQRYITCYGKTGISYFNIGYAASSRNSAELLFSYSSSGSGSNYAGLSLYGGENTIFVYPGYTKSVKYINAPGFVHPDYWSSDYALTSDGGVAHIGSMSVNYANSSGSTAVWTRSWQRGHNALVDLASYHNQTRVFMADADTTNKPSGAGAGFIISNAWDWGGGGSLIYQDFDTDYGRLFTNAKTCDGSYQGWKKVAWTSDIPTVSNSNGYVPRLVSFPSYSHFGSSTNTYDYLQNIVKWIYDNANYGGHTYLMGVGNPNSLGMMNIQLYGDSGKNSAGWPRYCSGTFLNLGDSAFEIFGTVDYNYYRYRLSVDGHGHRITKLHRRDSSDDYSLQHHWTGSYWYLRGYLGDSFHAEVQVGYANSAGSATTCSYPAGFTSRGTSDWSGVAGTLATDWSVNGADIMFKYEGSQLNVITDGRFYQGIDIYGASKRVLDEYDIDHTTWGSAKTHAGYSRTITVNGDPNTYYPVVINTPYSKNLPNIVTIWKNLGSTTASYAGNHENGTASCLYRYDVRINVWDGNGGYCKCLNAWYGYAPLVAHTELTYSSVGHLCIWLRGGGTTYEISSTWDAGVTVYYSRTDLYGSPYSCIVEPRTSIGNGGKYSSTYLGYGDIAGNVTGSSYSSTISSYLSGHHSSPNNSHPGHGAKVFYSWNIGSVGNDTAGYSTGITIGSNPNDTGYGFQIVQNLWDDRTYTRRYNGGWQNWKTLAWTSDIPTVTDYYWANIKVSASSSTSTQPTFNTCYTSNWFRSTGNTGWYSETHGGGWYMTDSTWVRTYNSKGVLGKGFYHSDYGSATYLLRSDGGVSAFNWSGQGGQPTWIWGGNSQHAYYVYNPSNFSVNYANSAGYTTRLYANSDSNLVTDPGYYSLSYSRFQSNASNIFPVSNNANGCITAHLHAGNYFAQIGLSSDGRMYYRAMIGETLDSGVAWNKVAWTSEIPSVGNGTVTITQNGVNKGSFTMNQSGNTTIALTDTDTDTNTWRTVQCNGTSIGSNTLNLKAGTNVSLSNSSGAITITATDTNYYPVRYYTSGLQISTHSGNTNCALYVPHATTSQDGVINTADQSFKGNKTFTKINSIDPGYLLIYAGRVYKKDGSTSASSQYGMPGFSVSVTKLRAGAYKVTLTNNTGRSCYIHPILSPVFADKGEGSCYEHGFAYFSSGDTYMFPTLVGSGSTKTFTIICGYMHTQGSWKTNDFTKSNDGGGFTCEIFATWSY